MDNPVADRVKAYWEDRAQARQDVASTTDDVYLRELEVSTLIKVLGDAGLPSGASILDVGCGDGWSTIRIAQAFPRISFHGIDFSANMIELATKRLIGQELADRVSFAVGDATALDSACGDAVFDAVLTDRCLINLTSLERQALAVSQIAAHLKPGGLYVAIENFMEGQDKMNAIRSSMGLSEIPVRWHNLYFTEDGFRRITDPSFEEFKLSDFTSSYYFATRVIYSSMCQMRNEKPDYRHEIHQLAVKLPSVGDFSPIKMAVLRKRAK